VLDLGQTIGLRLRSKEAALQLKHRRFAPSSALATAFSFFETVYTTIPAIEDWNCWRSACAVRLHLCFAPIPAALTPAAGRNGEMDSGTTPEFAAGRLRTSHCAFRRRSHRKPSDHLRDCEDLPALCYFSASNNRQSTPIKSHQPGRRL
jgi:hypothetical protein